jgi:hypothetical protein
MATIQNELVIIGLSGKMGKQLAICRNHDGQAEICASPSPPNHDGHCDAPDSHHQQLYEALLYSRTAPAVSCDEIVKARPKLTTQALAADVIHAPEIHGVDLSKYTGQAGDTIRITAGDDVRVASVGLLIVTDEGVLVEQGAARVSDQNPYIWTYVATANALSRFVKIVVDVADIAPRDDSVVMAN